jgi:DNA helicase-2/ATP-dependent DNA helicase PcrA
MRRTLFELSDEQKRVMAACGNLLVLGGPGSGKTTVATLKAGKIVRESLRHSQKVLFLSFARPTVARIIEALSLTTEIDEADKRAIEVDTYHAFFWRLIRSHGYLLGLPRRLSLLAPAAEAVVLSSIRNAYPRAAKLTDAQRAEKAAAESQERMRLAFEEGKVCFDLFADLTARILDGGQKIRELVSEAYPYIILDEFQDTDAEQWTVVRAVGQGSEVVALADPEQRIYEFIGADPERINHYREEFQPTEFDLRDDNFRSPGTDIAKFGDDILAGQFRSKTYNGITAKTFAPNQPQAYAAMKAQVFEARRRQLESGREGWAVAVLVPTKKMTRTVSDYLRSQQSQMPPINHTAAVDVEAAILAAEIIAFLLQPKAPKGDFRAFVRLVCNFYEGRGGDTPAKTHIEESTRISVSLEKASQAHASKKKVHKKSLILPMLKTYTAARKVSLVGDPEEDWRAIRRTLEEGDCKRLNEVAAESRNLRLLGRGTQLRAALSQCWRDGMSYENALEIVQRAFVQEHFASAWRPESGVVVMNMHKAKGKQFDEVIIFEGWPRYKKGKIISNPDRIVRGNMKEQDLGQARQNFRVSITRARTQTSILTPQGDPCVLFLGA